MQITSRKIQIFRDFSSSFFLNVITFFGGKWIYLLDLFHDKFIYCSLLGIICQFLSHRKGHIIIVLDLYFIDQDKP